jgi:hypothetical protein
VVHRLNGLNRLNREDGAVVVLVAVLAIVLFAVAAYAVDLGNGWAKRREAQTAADAAALAGAQALDSNPAGTASSYASANGWSGAAVHRPPSTGPNAGDANCVEVTVEQSIDTIFAGVIGAAEIDVGARAVACGTPGGVGGPCGLCVLGPEGQTLTFTGNGGIEVTNQNIIVNSPDNPAVNIVGNADVVAEAMGGPAAPGGWRFVGNGSFDPPPVNMPPIDDPLAFLPMCPAAGSVCPSTTNDPQNVKVTGNQDLTVNPGIYNRIELTGNGNLTLSPGTYIIKDEIEFTGNGSLLAEGVTIYLACSNYPTPCTPGQQGGRIIFTGNGNVEVSPPTSGEFEGLAVFADRNNTLTDCNAANASHLTGNGSLLSVGGTIYMKNRCLKFTGNGNTINSLTVVHSARIVGNGAIEINADPDQNVPIVGAGGAVLSE